MTSPPTPQMAETRHPSESITFTVPGKPEPWRRARTHGRLHFKDAKTAANQSAWAWAAARALAGRGPMAGPLAVTIEAAFPVPKAASKAKRQAMLDRSLLPVTGADLDNIVKNLDGLNKVAFADDAQIVRITASKFYALEAGVTVSVMPLEPQGVSA